MFLVKVLSVILVSYWHYAGAQMYQRNVPYPYLNYQQPPIQLPYYYPQNYPFFPYPNPIGVTQKPAIDPYLNIPTEIIDVDENLIVPEAETIDIPNKPEIKKNQQDNYQPYIVEKTSYSNSNANQTKSIHIFESKPIQTVIRKVITSNGKDGQNVINIHLVNGVEITSENPGTDNKTKDEEDEEEEEETNSEDDGNDPKPVDSWIFG